MQLLAKVAAVGGLHTLARALCTSKTSPRGHGEHAAVRQQDGSSTEAPHIYAASG